MCAVFFPCKQSTEEREEREVRDFAELGALSERGVGFGCRALAGGRVCLPFLVSTLSSGACSSGTRALLQTQTTDSDPSPTRPRPLATLPTRPIPVLVPQIAHTRLSLPRLPCSPRLDCAPIW
jgi:hypothetical protein